MSKIRTSIIIVNHNGFIYVKKCLESILASNTKSYEIIIVDNGSSDQSVTNIKKEFRTLSNLKVIELDKNYGPAKARNEGVAKAEGEFIGFLDNDTEVDENWASSAVDFLQKNPTVGVLQCKLLLANERSKIDYVGEYLGQNGFLVQLATTGEVDRGQYDEVVPILAAKSAGMFITKKAFEAAGGFDDDYFIYVEETDLGWRVWLQGYKVLFFPDSVVYHEFGTSSVILSKSKNNYNTKFHGCKNYILTLFKNLSTPKMLIILPAHIILWYGLAWFSLAKKQYQTFVCIHMALFWHITHFKESLSKRRKIQSSRKVLDNEFLNVLMRRRPFKYYLDKAITIRKTGNAEGFVKNG